MHIPPQWLKTRKKEQKKQAPESLSQAIFRFARLTALVALAAADH